jgi:hypothetical protein
MAQGNDHDLAAGSFLDDGLVVDDMHELARGAALTELVTVDQGDGGTDRPSRGWRPR